MASSDESSLACSGPGAPMVIPGGVSGGSAPIDAPGDLVIQGSVAYGATIRAGGGVTVRGSVENATILAGGDLTVHGSIVGGREGRYASGGSVRARVITNATIEAQDDVSSELEISNSRVIAGGAVRCPIGHVLGGHITANAGVLCGTLGSPGIAGVPTLVEVAIDETLRRLSAQHVPTINANLDRIGKVRTKVQPLMAHLKHLTAQQKETATELLAQASVLEDECVALAASLKTALADSLTRGVPVIYVAAVIHPGTTIRFPVAQMTVEKQHRVPARLSCQGRGAAAKIVQVNPSDRSPMVPKFALYADVPITDLQRAIADVEALRQPVRKAA